ncbi:(NiFe) hydrogenase maturation protein [Elusimicrobium minutum Pei191]|uniref:Carbamoyltransferase n=1 Tax=Elusimicrobium minutum (strain Pei191) TaxID=445932 RepID=B2KBC6_ELUMP|nr:carbamoyltransferase HypF [Elusimicrobium minutum]ACC97948.1 (NiFe) hydrogenase maturation protein [Elusimicrobium minutum Pei191]
MLRKRILINGVVQGVGFRPFIYKSALKFRLSGFVQNTSAGVITEAQGSKENINKFILFIKQNCPPQAKIEDLKITDIKEKKEKGFLIIASKKDNIQTVFLPPDLAMCKDCGKEILNPKDRRFLYPLTNCTNCGPRLSITKTLPYDRKATTMSKFKMCPACQKEYESPNSRRFHAQPNACPVCGPQVFFKFKNKNFKGLKALKTAAVFLDKGKITAVKSIGGYHLACDAKNPKAVTSLRLSKKRPYKPLAIMFKDLKTAKKYCFINKIEARALLSPAAPIVIVKKKKELKLISDNLNNYGIMLPYTPLHKILFSLLKTDVLVMTSGNAKGGALCSGDGEAFKKLSKIADGFLYHEREIYNKVDDSIMFEALGKMRFIRRARGFAPLPATLAKKAKKSILALGADKTAAFCLVKENKAYLSQYIGDLNKKENGGFYLTALEKNKRLLGINPQVTIADLHPGYFTNKLPFKNVNKIQHHAAHALSVAAEHNLKGRFLAVNLDGSGLGSDGAIWGGEFLAFNNKNWKRAAYFEPLPLPAGDESVSEIWLLTLGAIKKIYGKDWTNYKYLFKNVPRQKFRLALKLIDNGINVYNSSSAGRVFDIVSHIALGITKTTYQAQAAMELEAKCLRLKSPYKVVMEKQNGCYIIKTGEMLKEILSYSRSAEEISARFHAYMVYSVLETAKKLKLKNICLSGGVFQNKVLLKGTVNVLKRAGFNVYLNEQTPCNDGGLALGQAWNMV